MSLNTRRYNYEKNHLHQTGRLQSAESQVTGTGVESDRNIGTAPQAIP